MLPNWPTTKVEAYKYTDLSKVGALVLPAGQIISTVSPPLAGESGAALSRAERGWVLEPIGHPHPNPLPPAGERALQTQLLTHTLPAARSQSAHKLRLERGVKLLLVETITSARPGIGVAHQQLTIELEEGARLIHIRRQAIDKSAFHWGQTSVMLGRDSTYQHIALHTGGALTRHEILAECNAAGAEFEILALQLLGAGQHGDITTTIRHNAPHTRSNQLVKSVLTGDARGVFQGQIRVAPHAQKTNSQQQSRALLLSPQAEMNTKPELEIFADDVICSHGAATGALDDMQLFYLQSRGLSRALAQSLLISGFAAEVFDHVHDEAHRTGLQQEAEQWLAQLS